MASQEMGFPLNPTSRRCSPPQNKSDMPKFPQTKRLWAARHRSAALLAVAPQLAPSRCRTMGNTRVSSYQTKVPSHQLTWKCTDPCRKTTFLLERAFLHFHVSWWEGTSNGLKPLVPSEFWLSECTPKQKAALTKAPGVLSGCQVLL